MQFHPTAVVAPNGADGFLVTEAVRGEGATLRDKQGNRFVDELAPRDEVARAVQRQMVSSGAASVDLDMRDVDPALFPNVVTALRNAGIDPERELVPVAPAAHYMMGGIATDLRRAGHAARALRRRGVLVHGAARRQPARLELADRVLRVRGTRRALGAPGARAEPDGGAEQRDPTAAPADAGEPRGALATTPASSATAKDCRR